MTRKKPAQPKSKKNTLISNEQRKKNQKQRLIATIVVAGLISVLAGSWWLLNRYFVIEKIECSQAGMPCPTIISSQFEPLIGQSMFFGNYDQVTNKFGDHEMEKHLPNLLKIKVVSSNAPISEMPAKFFENFPTSENTKNDEDLAILFTTLNKNNISMSSVEIKKEVFIVNLNDRVRALVDKNDSETGVYRLNQVLKNLDLDQVDLNIVEIDTRFKMPVLKTEQTELE